MKQPIRCFFSQTNSWGACALFASVALDLGCAKIAGIDSDVPVNPNGANGSALCNEYCDTVMTNCPDPLYVYASRDMCMGVPQVGNSWQSRKYGRPIWQYNQLPTVPSPTGGKDW